MKPSACFDRVVDMMEELFRFILLMRERADALVDRYSACKEHEPAPAVAASLADAAATPKRLFGNSAA